MKRLLARGFFVLTSVLFLNIGVAEAATAVVSAPEPLPFNFTATPVGQNSVEQTFTVSKASGGVLDPYSIVSVNFSAATTHFTITSDNCTGVDLNPTGDTCTFAVRFNPTALGAQAASITVTAGGGDTMIASFDAVTGTGLHNATVQFSQPVFSVNEAAATVNATLEVTRSGDLSGAGNVTVNLTDGTAVGGAAIGAGVDYVNTALTFTFAAGQSSATQTVAINGVSDTEVEPTESFVATIASTTITNAGIGPNSVAQVNIQDNDSTPAPGAFSWNPSNFAVSEEAGSFDLCITRDNGSDGAAAVDYTVLDGSAVNGSDFVLASGTANFADGQTIDCSTIALSLTSDNLIEGSEFFTIYLSNPTGGAALGENPSLSVTLVDDDSTTASVSFQSAAYTVSEDAGSVILTLIRSGDLATQFDVDVATNDGTALSPGDYTGGLPTTVTFLAGEFVKIVPVAITDDGTSESTESFFVTLDNLLNTSGFTSIGSPSQAEVTILDEDGPTTFSMGALTYSFGEGVIAQLVTVNRSGDTSNTDTVDLTATNISATGGGTDYDVTPTGTLTFNPGETSKNILVTLTDDPDIEGNETFTLDLSAPSAGTTVDPIFALSTVAIVDNDTTPGVFDISPAVVSVNESGAPTVVLTINRTGGSSGAVNVPYTLLHGTTDASDIGVATASPIAFINGQTSATISIPILDDLTVENSEFFTVVLGAPTAGVLGANTSSKVFIEDNETPPNPGVIQFSQPVYSFNEDGGTVAIYVTRTGGSDGSVDVNFVVNSGTAVDATDFIVNAGQVIPVNFPDGNTTPQTIEFDLNDDHLVEPTETFSVILEQPTGGAVLGDNATAEVNIIDNDTPANPGRIEFSQPVYNVTEGITTATLYAVRLDGSDGQVDFDVLTADGTALAPVDYTALTAAAADISFADGDVAPKPIQITIASDTDLETTENFSVLFTTPNGGGSLNGATLGDAATVNIVDDDSPGVLQLSQPVYSFSEGVGSASITVTRTGGSSGAVSIKCATSNGSATSADYTAVVSSTLNWADGDAASKTCSVSITDDAAPESTEDFSVHLFDITGGAILGPITSAQVLIEDNDSTPNPGIVEFSQPTFTFNETDANFNATVYAIRRDGSEGSVTANVTFVDGTAIGGGTDFTPITASVTWGNGVTAPQPITFTVIGDTFQEAVESFNIILSGPTNGAVLGPKNNAEVRLLDDDGTGVIEFGASDYTFDESAGTVTIVVNRNGGVDPTGVSFTVTPGTATGGGTDFNVTTASPLTFGTGVTVQTISIDINNDLLDESNEQFTISLNGPTNGAVVGPNGTATITINDNDGAGELQFDRADYSTLEDNAGIALQVRRVGGSDGAVSVDFSLSENSALSPEDFGAPSPATTLNWADGDSAPKSIVIPIVADLLVEGDEVFNVFLSGPTGGASLGSPDAATVTIVDDESPGKFSFSSAVYGVEEAEGTVTLSVLRRGGSKGEVTVDFETVSGTATSPTDYETRTGTLTWPDGDASPRLISVPIHDTDNEKTRTFTMVLSNPTGEASLEDPSVATVNIGFGIPSVPNSTDGGGCALTTSSSQSDSAPAWLLLAGLLSLAFFRTRGRALWTAARTVSMIALSSVFLMASGATGCNKRPPVPEEAVQALERLVTEAQSFLNSFADVESCEGLNKAVDDLNADQVIPCDTGETQASALVTQCNDGPFSGTATVVGVAQNCVDTSDGTTLDGTVTYTIHTDGTQDVTFSSAGATVNGINYPVGGVTVTTSGGATTCEGVLTVLDLPCTVTPDCSTCEFLQ